MLPPAGSSQSAVPFGKVVGGILLHHWLGLVTTATAGSRASSRLRGVAQMREAPRSTRNEVVAWTWKMRDMSRAVRKLWEVYSAYRMCTVNMYVGSIIPGYHELWLIVVPLCRFNKSTHQATGIPSTHCTTTLGDFYNHNTIRSLSHARLQWGLSSTIRSHPLLPTLFTLAFLIGWKLIKKWKRNASVSRKHHSELVSWTCETEPTSTIRCGFLPVSEAAPWGSFTWR